MHQRRTRLDGQCVDPESARAPVSRQATQEVLAREFEEPLCLRVDDDYVSFAIDDDDRVGRSFEETSKSCFNFLPCCGVSNDADDYSTGLSLQRA